jgi:hypothetical protein
MPQRFISFVDSQKEDRLPGRRWYCEGSVCFRFVVWNTVEPSWANRVGKFFLGETKGFLTDQCVVTLFPKYKAF